MKSEKGFPRSKKIYIRVFDLGYSMTQVDEENNYQAEDFSITNAEWIFEIDLPEKFYNYVKRHIYKIKRIKSLYFFIEIVYNIYIYKGV